jgi:hypothetical protein
MRISHLTIITVIIGLAAWLSLGLYMFGDLPIYYGAIVWVVSGILHVSYWYLIFRIGKQRRNKLAANTQKV